MIKRNSINHRTILTLIYKTISVNGNTKQELRIQILDLDGFRQSKEKKKY